MVSFDSLRRIGYKQKPINLHKFCVQRAVILLNDVDTFSEFQFPICIRILALPARTHSIQYTMSDIIKYTQKCINNMDIYLFLISNQPLTQNKQWMGKSVYINKTTNRFFVRRCDVNVCDATRWVGVCE